MGNRRSICANKGKHAHTWKHRHIQEKGQLSDPDIADFHGINWVNDSNPKRSDGKN